MCVCVCVCARALASCIWKQLWPPSPHSPFNISERRAVLTPTGYFHFTNTSTLRSPVIGFHCQTSQCQKRSQKHLSRSVKDKRNNAVAPPRSRTTAHFRLQWAREMFLTQFSVTRFRLKSRLRAGHLSVKSDSTCRKRINISSYVGKVYIKKNSNSPQISPIWFLSHFQYFKTKKEKGKHTEEDSDKLSLA